jgi:hypothetical protein
LCSPIFSTFSVAIAYSSTGVTDTR